MTAVETGMETPSALTPPAPEGMGARLKSAREHAGLSLDQVAQQLKLAPRQVRALEDEDFAQLPGRTFARGFVRNYARLLRLDGDDLLARLPDATHAPALAAPSLHSTGSTMGEVPTMRGAPSTFGRWLIPLALVVCVVAAGAYEWYRNGLATPNDAVRDESTPAPTAAPAPVSPVPVAPAGTARSELPNPLTAVPAAEPAAENRDAAPVASAGTATAPAGAASATAGAAAVQAPVEAPAPIEPPAPIVLTYRGAAWTDVRDRDGHVLIARLVPAGSEQAIRGNAPFDVVIGNAQNVALVYLGQTVDMTRYTRANVARLRLLP